MTKHKPYEDTANPRGGKILFREPRQLGFDTLNGNLAVIGWVGLVYGC